MLSLTILNSSGKLKSPSPGTVYTPFKTEFKKLESFAKKLDGIDQLQKWDSAYYSEKLKKELFDLDQEILKPYFKLENVIEGVFMIVKKLYDLQFEQVFNIDKYHEDVKTYQVTNTKGDFISVFYADFHPRPGKRGGAWMTSFKPQYKNENEIKRKVGYMNIRDFISWLGHHRFGIGQSQVKFPPPPCKRFIDFPMYHKKLRLLSHVPLVAV